MSFPFGLCVSLIYQTVDVFIWYFLYKVPNCFWIGMGVLFLKWRFSKKIFWLLWWYIKFWLFVVCICLDFLMRGLSRISWELLNILLSCLCTRLWTMVCVLGILWFVDYSVLQCINPSSVSSTEKDIDTRLMKAWTAIDRLSIIWKSNLTDKMKRSFFQAVIVLILLYGCTIWTLTKWLEKKLDGNYTRMLRAILNKSWQQYPTRRQLYGHLPPITKTIQARRTRHAGHCWRSKDEIVSDVLLWNPAYGQSKAGRPAWTYIQQLCDDTGCNPEDLPEAMNDRETWRERVRYIRASRMTWWWWTLN